MKILSISIIILLFIFPTNLFTQKFGVKLRLNTNIEKAVLDFEELTPAGLRGSQSDKLRDFALRGYNGDIYNWGGLGVTANTTGRIKGNLFINVGIGYQYKSMRLDFDENYKQIRNFNTAIASSNRIDFEFNENYRLSIFKLPVTFSYDLFDEKISMIAGLHMHAVYRKNVGANTLRRDYNTEAGFDSGNIHTFGSFMTSDDFTKAMQYLVVGTSWRFKPDFELEILYRHPLRDVASTELGAIKARPSIEIAVSYWSKE